MSYNNIAWPPSPSAMFPVLSIGVLVAILGRLTSQYYINQCNPRRLPPAPTKQWFRGNKDFLTQPRLYALLGTRYKIELGDVISIVTPMNTDVFVSTVDLATDLFGKRAAVTANYPRNVMANEILGWDASPAFRQRDEIHKEMRTVLASGLNSTAARSYSALHLRTALDFLRRVAANPSSFRALSDQMVVCFTMGLAYGYVPQEENDLVVASHRETFQYCRLALSNYYLVNDFPILKFVPRWFPGAGFKRFGEKGSQMRTRYASKTFDMVLEQVRSGRIERPSYVSGLLELRGGTNASESDIELIKWTAIALFNTMPNQVAILINSFFLMACLFPEAMKEAQAEIDSVVGRDRIPNLDDRSSLPYTNAVVLETMRMWPPVPLASHVVTEEIEFRGYRIPGGTRVHANIWAMLRDPNRFICPHTFNPSRFVGSNPEWDPRKYIFGFGPRSCPGVHIAQNSVWITCVGLLSVFDIQAGPRLKARVASLGGRWSDRLYELTEPHRGTDPMPFECEIKLRDSAAASALADST